MAQWATRRSGFVIAGVAVIALAGALVFWRSRGQRSELAACSDRAWVDRVAAANAKLASTQPFAPAWTSLRDALCQLPASDRPGNAGARLRCLDGRAREIIALAQLVDRERPAHVPAAWSFMVPYECASDHAEALAALEPDAEHVDEVVRIRFALAQQHPALDDLDAAAHRAGFPPLVHEVALARGAVANGEGNEQPLRDVAVAAEQSGHVIVVAQARLSLLLRALYDTADRSHVREAFDRSDAAIVAAGDPPDLRARWFAVQSFDARSRSDEQRVRAAITRAEQLIETYRVPVDARLLDDIAASYTWLGNLEQAMTYYKRAVDVAKTATPADQLLAQTNYGLALCDANKLDESLAVLAPAVRIAEHGTFAPPERAHTVLQYARAANTAGKYALALTTLDDWAQAIAKLPAHSMVAGRLGYERAVALMGTGKHDDAAREIDAALAIFRDKLGAQSSLTADAQIFAGQIAYERHQLDSARSQLERGIADMIAVDGDEAPRVAQGRVWLAKTLLAAGDVEHARPVIERAMTVFGKVAGGEDDYMEAEVIRARTLPASERAQAIQTLERALVLWRKDPESWKAEIAEVEAQLAAWRQHR